MAEEYEAFVRDRDHAVSGNQVVLTLRDLTPGRHKYKGINVRAVISEAPVAGEPLLWLRSVSAPATPPLAAYALPSTWRRYSMHRPTPTTSK